MRLKRVDIKNFRSIKDQKVTFERNFQVLVGINESGKTNLIKAVSLLNEKIDFSKDDVRDPGHDEDAVTESYVRFVFKVENFLLEKLSESTKEEVLAIDLNSAVLDIGDKSCSIDYFCRKKDEVLYKVNLLKEERSLSYWSTSGPQYRIHPNWKKIKRGASHPIVHNGEPSNLSRYSIVNTDEFGNLPENFLDDLDIHSLNNFVGDHLKKISKEYLPTCILWNYSDDNLLPARINLSQFVNSPQTCAPLKNMFSLAGYHDVTKSLKEAQQKTNGLRNILRKVSENSTAHMKKVWPEWKKQKVILSQNGDFLEAGIEDEFNVYSLARRSDGFKRFFTFLLMISVQNKTEEIHDNLIVIDEPDIGLHPSGVQYLKEELKKIGEHNIVLASTHSIFMIDKEITDRHLIVEKDKEVTSIRRVDTSNISDEEVIYKALGYSLYELLKPRNIIFEGWRDKRCFEIFCNSKTGKKLLTKEDASKIGFLHAIGVKDIPRIANLCENFTREYVIISDSDKPAKEKQKSFEGLGKWFCYNDIKNIRAVTTEDFMSNALINRSIDHVFKTNDINHKLRINDDIKDNKIDHIETKIAKLEISTITTKELLNQIKEHSSLNAVASDFDERYFDVCKFIIDEIMHGSRIETDA